MIRAVAELDWADPPRPAGVSRQKKDAIFEVSCRVVLIAERARATDGASLVEDALAEKRKLLRFGLDLIAQGADAAHLDLAYRHSPISMDLDAGTRLELAAIRAGLGSLVGGENPWLLFRRMTAFLGPEYFDKAGDWLLAKLKKRPKAKEQSVLVPGDLPDLVRSLAFDPRSLERAIRAAGRDLSMAALAGCGQESIDLVAGFFGPIGSRTFEEDAVWLRAKLSGDEIGQAQSAFMDVVRNLEDGGELAISEEDEFAPDPDFVHALTKAVMALDEKTLRTVFRAGDGRLLALALQGLEPRAHERILGLLPKRHARRLMDAVDDAAILPRREVLLAGKTLAEAVLAGAALSRNSRREAIEAFERVRDWVDEGSIAGI